MEFSIRRSWIVHVYESHWYELAVARCPKNNKELLYSIKSIFCFHSLTASLTDYYVVVICEQGVDAPINFRRSRERYFFVNQ